MNRTYEVVPAETVTTRKRRSPMHLIADRVQGDFWTMKNVAEHIGVHIETIRRVTKKLDDQGNRLVTAPTYAIRAGEAVIYQFTMADVQEIEQYFEGRGYVIRTHVDPTRTLAEQRPQPAA